VPYHETDFVIVEEGLSMGDHDDRLYSLDECKRLCDHKTGCNSFAYSQGLCYLKDKCVSKTDALRFGNRFKTYFKSCHTRVHPCCEDGCSCTSNKGYYKQCMPISGSDAVCTAGPTATTTTMKAFDTSQHSLAEGMVKHEARRKSAGWVYDTPWLNVKPKGTPAPQTPKMVQTVPSALPLPEVCATAYELCHGAEAWHGASCCEPGCSCRPRGKNISECVPPKGRYMCLGRSRPSTMIFFTGLKRDMERLPGLVSTSALGRVLSKAALPLAMVFTALLAVGLAMRLIAPRPDPSWLMLQQSIEDPTLPMDSTAVPMPLPESP